MIITSNASPGERGWGRRGGQGRGEDKESLPCPGDGGEDREDKEMPLLLEAHKSRLTRVQVGFICTKFAKFS